MIDMPILKTDNDLFIFLLHLIHNRFPQNAILKGGMVLRLLGSKRRTLDLDYVFIPFTSKKDLAVDVENLFKEVVGLTFGITVNSKAIRVNISYENLRSQVEISVSQKVKSDIISTANLKDMSSSVSPRIIKIMSLDIALAHKLAAWNERRLFRDLYDAYYLLEVQMVSPDMETLVARLKKIESRLPKMKKIRAMSLSKFFGELRLEAAQLTQSDLDSELAGVLDEVELAGLAYKLKDCLNRLILNCS